MARPRPSLTPPAAGPFVWLSLAYLVILCAIKEAEHRSFQLEMDLAVWDQAIWQVSRGMFPFSSIFGTPKLSDHFDPLCFIISPFYAIHPTVLWLFLFQGLFTVAAAAGLYRLALHLELSPRLALTVAALFLFAPGTIYQALYPLHMEALAMALWIWAIYRLLKLGDLRFALLACFLSSLCKEEGPLAFLLLAVYLAVFHPALRRHGLILGTFAVALMGVMLGVLAPMIRAGHGPNLMAKHYGAFGSSLPQVALHLVIWPNVLFAHLLTWENAKTLLELIGPTAGLCLAYPPAAVIYMPLWAANAISELPTQRVIFYHYHIALLPAIYYGLIRGLRAHPRAAGVAAAATVVALALVNPLEGRFPVSGAHRQELESAVGSIPPSASALVPIGVVSHMSERPTVYVYPDPDIPYSWNFLRHEDHFDYVLLDYQDDLPDVLKVFASEALNDPAFHLVYRLGTAMVLQRGAAGHAEGLASLPDAWKAVPDVERLLRAYSLAGDEVGVESLLRSQMDRGLPLNVWVHLGLLAAKLGDLPTARTAFRKALDAPDLPPAVRQDIQRRMDALPREPGKPQ